MAGRAPLVGFGDDVAFELRLVQAIAWCEPHARADDPAGSLRNDQLRPRLLETDRATTVRGVARWRETLVSRDLAPVGTLADLRGGRLLVYFPDAELADGAAEHESAGFFDVHNAPPWDTWIALFRDAVADESFAEYLVSWVPPALIELAQRGIRVNPEECMLWIDDSRTSLVAELRSRGLSR